VKQDQRPRIWIHAVSVGEVVASSAVIRALPEKFPSHRVLISTTTSTGQKLAAQRFGAENVFYFPAHFAFAIQPYLDALRPELVVVAETEFWPNFLRLAKQGGARIAVINCRISDRSLPGYKRFPLLVAEIAGADSRQRRSFSAANRRRRRRLIEIVARIEDRHRRNLKFDMAPPPAPAIVASLRENFGTPHPAQFWFAAARWKMKKAPCFPRFATFSPIIPRRDDLAPRHPERFAEVADLVGKLGFRMSQRSLWSGEPLAGGVFLVDSIGELASLYSVATVAFVAAASCRAADTTSWNPLVWRSHRHRQPLRELPRHRQFLASRTPFDRRACRTPARVDGADREQRRTRNARPECTGRAGIAARRNGQNRSGSAQVDERAVRRLRMNPLTGIYGAATALRNTLYDRGALSSRRLQQPVVSVGNLSAVVPARPRSSSRSANSCKHVHSLRRAQRGYRRKTRGVLVVEPDGSAADFGDEPLLIARRWAFP